MKKVHRAVLALTVLSLALSGPLLAGEAGKGKPIDFKPKVVNKVAPVYPEEAREAKLQGKVVVRLDVAADGTVQDLEAVEGPDALRQAAVDAVRQWRFEASERDFEFHVTINFRLDQDEKSAS